MVKAARTIITEAFSTYLLFLPCEPKAVAYYLAPTKVSVGPASYACVVTPVRVNEQY
jgi:hypothetical protein